MTASARPRTIRIAISGCGAVTELYYAPVLRAFARTGRVEVVALSDPDPGRRDTLGAMFPLAARYSEFEAVFDLHPQLLIVASPPGCHAEQTVTALAAGVHVLCEKPLAISSAEARRIADAEAANARLLAIGMVRRHMPAARMIRAVLAREMLGTLGGFEVFEGGPFDWPVHGTQYFAPHASGGGVLLDIGAHVLDLLVWWLGAPSVLAAEDDAMGGIEANARLTLRCGEVPGVVRLSRDWHRPNHVTLTGAKGSLCWSLEYADRILVRLDGEEPLELRAPAGEPSTFLDCFRAQMRAVLDATDGSPAEVVRAAELLPSIGAIETAYRKRSLMTMPWLSAREHGAALRARSSGASS
jgi:predicted dehydrogenase